MVKLYIKGSPPPALDRTLQIQTRKGRISQEARHTSEDGGGGGEGRNRNTCIRNTAEGFVLRAAARWPSSEPARHAVSKPID